MTTVGSLSFELVGEDSQLRTMLEKYRTQTQTLTVKLNVEGAQTATGSMAGLEAAIGNLSGKLGALAMHMTEIGKSAQQGTGQARTAVAGLNAEMMEAVRTISTAGTSFQRGALTADQYTVAVSQADVKLKEFAADSTLGTKELQLTSAALNTVAKAFGTANTAQSPYLAGLNANRAAMNEVKSASAALNQEVLQLRRQWQMGEIDEQKLAAGMTVLGERARAALAPLAAQKQAILDLGVVTKEQDSQLQGIIGRMNGFSLAAQRAAAGVNSANNVITKGSVAASVQSGTTAANGVGQAELATNAQNYRATLQGNIKIENDAAANYKNNMQLKRTLMGVVAAEEQTAASNYRATLARNMQIENDAAANYKDNLSYRIKLEGIKAQAVRDAFAVERTAVAETAAETQRLVNATKGRLILSADLVQQLNTQRDAQVAGLKAVEDEIVAQKALAAAGTDNAERLRQLTILQNDWTAAIAGSTTGEVTGERASQAATRTALAGRALVLREARIAAGELASGNSVYQKALQGSTTEVQRLAAAEGAGLLRKSEYAEALMRVAAGQRTTLINIQAEIASLGESGVRDVEETARLEALTAAQKGFTSALEQTIIAQKEANASSNLMNRAGKLVGGGAGLNGAAMGLSFVSPELGMGAMLLQMGPAIAGIAGGFLAIGAAVKTVSSGMNDFAEWNRQMTQLQAITHLSGGDIQRLSGYFRDLSTQVPISAKDLGEMSRQAVLVGIHGVDGIKSYTENLANLSIVLRDANGESKGVEQTGQEIVKVLRSTGMGTEGLPAGVTKLTDSLVALKTESGVAIPQVTQLMKFWASQGAHVGLTVEQMTALSASLIQTGARAQGAGGALAIFFDKAAVGAAKGGGSLAAWAKVVGLSSDETQKLLQQDPMAFLQRFVEGANELDREGTALSLTLGGVGLNSQQVRRTIAELSNALPLLAQNTKIATDASNNGGTAMKTAGDATHDYKDKVVELGHSWDNLKLSIGAAFVPAANNLLDWLNNVLTTGQKAIDMLHGMSSASNVESWSSKNGIDPGRISEADTKTINSLLAQQVYYQDAYDKLVKQGVAHPETREAGVSLAQIAQTLNVMLARYNGTPGLPMGGAVGPGSLTTGPGVGPLMQGESRPKTLSDYNQKVFLGLSQSTGDAQAEDLVGFCLKWVRLHLEQADPAVSQFVEQMFRTKNKPHAGDVGANDARDNLKARDMLNTDWSLLKPGAAVFYGNDHVGIYLGKDPVTGADMVRGNNEQGVKNGRGVVSNERLDALGPKAGFINADDVYTYGTGKTPLRVPEAKQGASIKEMTAALTHYHAVYAASAMTADDLDKYHKAAEDLRNQAELLQASMVKGSKEFNQADKFIIQASAAVNLHAKAVDGASLSWEQWIEHRTRANELAQKESDLNDHKLSPQQAIDVQAELNSYRTDPVKAMALSEAERQLADRTARQEQATKDAEQAAKAAAKIESDRLTKQQEAAALAKSTQAALDAADTQLAQTRLTNLKANLSAQLTAHQDSAQARLNIQSNLGKKVLELDNAVATQVLKKAQDQADTTAATQKAALTKHYGVGKEPQDQLQTIEQTRLKVREDAQLAYNQRVSTNAEQQGQAVLKAQQDLYKKQNQQDKQQADIKKQVQAQMASADAQQRQDTITAEDNKLKRLQNSQKVQLDDAKGDAAARLKIINDTNQAIEDQAIKVAEVQRQAAIKTAEEAQKASIAGIPKGTSDDDRKVLKADFLKTLNSAKKAANDAYDLSVSDARSKSQIAQQDADRADKAATDQNNKELEDLEIQSLNHRLTALKGYHSDVLAGIKDNLTARAALIKQYADAEYAQEIVIAGRERDKALKALDPSDRNYTQKARAIGDTYQEAQDAANSKRDQANVQAQDAVTQSVRTSRDAYSKLADTLREKILLGKVDGATLDDTWKKMGDLKDATDKAGTSTNSYVVSAQASVEQLRQQAIDSATLTGAFNDVQDGGRRVVATQQEINDSIQRAIDLIPENQDQWAAYTTLLDNMEKAGTAAAGTLKHVTDEMVRLKGLLIGDESNSFIGDPSTNTIGEGGDFSAVQDGAKGIDGKIKPFAGGAVTAAELSKLIADIPNGLTALDNYQAALEQMATNGRLTTKQLEALKLAIQGVRDAAGPFKPLKGDNLEGRGLTESLTQDVTKDGALGAVSQEDQQHLQEAIAAATSDVLSDAITHLGKAGKDSPLYKMLSAELASRSDTQLIGDVGENPSDYADGARLINGTLGSKPLDSPQPNTLDFAGIMDGIKKNRLTSDQVMGLISGPDSGGLSKDEVEQVKTYLINTHQDVLDKTRAQDMAAFAIKKQLNQLSEKEIIAQQEAFDVAAAESTFVHATAGLVTEEQKKSQVYIDAARIRDDAVTAIHNKATADRTLLDRADTRAIDALKLQQARTALDLLHQTLGISERQFVTERARQDTEAENAAFKILQEDHKDTEAATKAHTAKLIEIEAQKNATLAGLDDKTSRARSDLGLSKMSADLEFQHTADLNGRKLISDRQYIEAKLSNAQVAATVQYSRDMADQMDSQLAYEKWQAARTAAERTAVTDRIALSKAEFTAYQTGLASIGTAFSGILSTLGLDGFAKINTALFSMVDTIEKVPKSLNEVKASAKNFSSDKSLGNLGGLLSSVGGVVGLAGAAISAIGQIGDAIASLDPKFAAWKKHLTDIANLEKTAAGSLKVGNFANSFYNQLQDDATNHEKLANAGFWQRLGWSLFGGAPKALDDAKSAALQKSGEVFQNFASDISNTLESTMLAAFDSGDWSNVEQAMSKSLNNLVAKMAIQTVIASSKLGPLINKLAKDVGDKAPQSVISADLKNIREAENTVLATGQKITSMLDGSGQDAPAVGSVNAANDRVQRMQTAYDKATTPSERAYYAEQLRQAKADQASITPSTGAAGNAPGLSVTASPQLVDALNANTKAMNDQLSARRGGVVGAQQPLLDQTGASGIAAQAISNSAATFNFDAIASLSQSIQTNLPIFDLATRRFDDGVTRQLSGFESLLTRYLGTPGTAVRPNVPGY